MKKSTSFELHFDPTGDLLAAAKECEADIFLQAYGNTRDEIADEYGQYERSSVFMALTDDAGDVIAETRLIAPSAVGLKTLSDTSREPWHVDGYRAARAAGLDLTQTWDVSTIGVRPGTRGSVPAAIAMYYGIWAATRANKMRWIVMLMDERARRLLTSISVDTHVLPGTYPGDYLGSPACTPLWADAYDSIEQQRMRNPEAYRLMGLGVGLDGITLPGPDGWVMRKRSELVAPELAPYRAKHARDGALLESA